MYEEHALLGNRLRMPSSAVPGRDRTPNCQPWKDPDRVYRSKHPRVWKQIVDNPELSILHVPMYVPQTTRCLVRRSCSTACGDCSALLHRLTLQATTSRNMFVWMTWNQDKGRAKGSSLYG